DEIKDASGKSEKLREELKSKHGETEGNLKLGQEQQIELQNTIDELRNKVSEIKNSLGSKRASLEFISGLIDSDENTKFLIKSTDWTPGSEKILLAEAVGADDAHRIAVDAALGEAATWFVCDTREDAVAATKILTDKNKGKASFICRENVPETKAPAKIATGKGVIGRMSEITRVDDVLRNSLRCLFGDMVLVETMVDAFKVIDAGKAETAVTLSGETVGRSGAMRGGSVAKNEGLTVGNRERIAKLKKEISKFETDEKTIGETLVSARAEYEAIDLRALNNEVRRAESEINTNEQNISRLNYRSESLVQNIKMQEKNAEQFIREIEETDTEIEALDGEASELHEKLQLIQEQQQSFITDLQNAEAHLRDVEQQTVAAEVKSVRAAGEIKSIQRETESLRYQKENIEIRKTAGEADIENNQTESFNAEVLIKSLTKEIEEIGLLSEKARAEREILDEQIKDLKDQITQYSNDIQDKRRHYESVTERLHKKELGAGELNTKIQSLSERAAEAYEIELLTYEYSLIAEFEIDVAKADLDAVKEKLSKIGNVNFMALDEFDTQSERMKFYEEQINDLEISEKNLSETIDEINLTAEGKFRETFDKVHKNFKELFVTLFSNEGYAELSLSDGDPLEADIEITAKPPGKKPHSIEGLSGGEKTLTAIALLFAIYLVKPAPFCILDEVDAPLDDANVGRFITLIRKFSDNTQFLLVTHNKKTMEACDSLYGITQQDEGVSKVVSVRLTSGSNS
ncbi:MAG: hypothetical protein PF588_09380, partial [Candidatus Kapabacteria bacterium]|nr:hypothetical protein [Candidatus Kapabacteria bacterium]